MGLDGVAWPGDRSLTALTSPFQQAAVDQAITPIQWPPMNIQVSRRPRGQAQGAVVKAWPAAGAPKAFRGGAYKSFDLREGVSRKIALLPHNGQRVAPHKGIDIAPVSRWNA
jgi:hypothetical protein